MAPSLSTHSHPHNESSAPICIHEREWGMVIQKLTGNETETVALRLAVERLTEQMANMSGGGRVLLYLMSGVVAVLGCVEGARFLFSGKF